MAGNYYEKLSYLKEQSNCSHNNYLPVFLRLNNSEDKLKFNELLSQPGVLVVDGICEQIIDLIKFKNPSKKFSPPELDLLLNEHLNGGNSIDYGVWVYYPWSNRLVHTLDEEEFVLVRTSRNQYKITPEEQKTLATKKIGVIGLSVGQSVSVTLAMERICGELRLADFDVLELTNLNRIRTGIHNLGLPKVYAVAREIAEIDPYLKVICYPEGLTETNMDDFFTNGGKLDLLIEESDGFDIKILSRYRARELKIPVIMEASDRCMVDVERFDLEPQRAILHGLVEHLDIGTLKNLKTNEEKIPYMLDILGIETSSNRLKASMLEIEQSINTWPQLASAVVMGGGITADVSRRMLLNHFTESGRYYVDVEEIISNGKLADRGSERKNGNELNQPFSQKKAQDLASIFPDTPKFQATKLLMEELALKANEIFLSPESKQLGWKVINGSLVHPLGNIKRDIEDYYFDMILIGASIETILKYINDKDCKLNSELVTIEKEDYMVISWLEQNDVHEQNDVGYLENDRTQLNQMTKNKKVTELVKSPSSKPFFKTNYIKEAAKIKYLAGILAKCERIETLHPDLKVTSVWNKYQWPVGFSFITKEISLKSKRLQTYLNSLKEQKEVTNLLYDWGRGTIIEKFNYKNIIQSSAIGFISFSKKSKVDIINLGRLIQQEALNSLNGGHYFRPICLSLKFYGGLNWFSKEQIFSDEEIISLKQLSEYITLIDKGINPDEGFFLFTLCPKEND